MGVAGSGKTTVGRLLAAKLGWEFADADELHPASNREKMHRGTALNDDDRRPWLEAVRALIADRAASGRGLVLACSALKQSYRETIMPEPAMAALIYLKGSRELIARRLAARRGHFFDPKLLASQFDALEEPHGGIVEDIARDPETIAESIRARIGTAAK